MNQSGGAEAGAPDGATGMATGATEVAPLDIALDAFGRQTAATPAGLADRVVRQLARDSVQPRGPALPVSSTREGRLALTVSAVRSLVRAAGTGLAGAQVVQVDVQTDLRGDVQTDLRDDEQADLRVRVQLVADRASTLPQVVRAAQAHVLAAVSQLGGVAVTVDVLVVDIDRI